MRWADLARPLIPVLLPAGALAAQAHSSLDVSVQVVRADYSTGAVARIVAAEGRDPAGPAINSHTECKAMGNMVIAAGVRATCSWDPDGHVYWVTVQY